MPTSVLMHVQVYNKLIKTTQAERSTVKVLQTQARFYMNPNLLNIHPIWAHLRPAAEHGALLLSTDWINMSALTHSGGL